MADLFELSASLFLDTSNYDEGIKGAENKFGSLKDLLVNQGKFQLKIAVDYVTNFAGDVLETGMGFDKQMSAVQAVLGQTEGTEENMIRLREEALKQARGSIFTAEETADAYYYMGMAGWKTEQMIKGLPAILQLAAASGEDLGMVTDIVTDSITAFGLTADDAQKYVNILAQTATNANTDVKRMGQTFKYVAPVAGALGYDFEDIALAIGLMASAGIKGSQAGTALRNILTRISTNAGQTSKDMGALEILTEKLGVSFFDSHDNARDFGDVLTELRAAWRGLNDEQKKNLAADYYGSEGGIEELTQNLKDAGDEIERLEGLRNSTKDTDEIKEYNQQIKELGGQYDKLLKLLGIEPNADGLYDYGNALDQARYKLGGMTDKERIYYANKIAGLRGMPGFLRLLEAEEKDITQLMEAYGNAEGAAKAMAGVRLDNLAGDLSMLNSAFDVLKIAIFDETKGPLRQLVQQATDAVNQITDAIFEDGLEGGIKKVSEILANAGETFGPILETIGKDIIGPIINGLLSEDTLHKFDSAFITIGKSLLKGIIEGSGLNTPGGIMNLLHLFVGALPNGLGTLLGWNTTNEYTFDEELPIVPTIEIDTEATIADIQAALDDANANGNFFVEIDGWTFATDQDPEFIKQVITSSAEEASADAAANYATNFDEASATVGNMVATDLNNAGVDGSSDAAAAYTGAMDTASAEVAGMVASDIGNSGTDAGNWLADGIQNALNSWGFTIPITGQITNIIGGNIHQNAVAMNTGRIYRKPTVFGYADGAFQEAGDAGAEAVVGVNSLQSMIAGAVNRAMGQQVVSVPVRDNRPIEITVKLADDTVLARAVHRMYDDEERRQGGNLTRGRA